MYVKDVVLQLEHVRCTVDGFVVFPILFFLNIGQFQSCKDLIIFHYNIYTGKLNSMHTHTSWTIF